MEDRHLQFQIILGVITECVIIAWLGYKLALLVGTVLEWLCNHVFGTVMAVGVGIMLLALVGVLIVMYTPKNSDEGSKDDA